MHPFALPHAGQLLPLLALSRPVTNLDLICMVWHRFAPHPHLHMHSAWASRSGGEGSSTICSSADQGDRVARPWR